MLVAGCSPEPVPLETVPPEAPPQGAFSCVGVPAGTCQQMLADARANASAGVVVVQMRIRCTVVPCTLQNGQAEADVVYSDGQRTTYGMGWSNAAAPPGG